MATQVNSRPAHAAAPLIRHVPITETSMNGNRLLVALLPAAVLSALVHVALGAGLYFLVSPDTQALETVKGKRDKDQQDENIVRAEDKSAKADEPPPPVTETNPREEENKSSDKEILRDVNREDTATMPGEVDLKEPIGVSDGKDKGARSSAGYSGFDGGTGAGDQEGAGGAGPVGPRGGDVGGSRTPTPGSIYGRSGATKRKLLQDGGTEESEAAVNRGLSWLALHQAFDGHWSLDGFHRVRPCNCRDAGIHNDTAATAFGVLPFLGGGYTHKPSRDKNNPNPYNKEVYKALSWLMRHQRKDGNFGGPMYAHGLATIALCEAYGLTQDPKLKHSAQAAVNFIVRAQHSAGGWRYSPGMAGDLSVVGWQVMALKSAQMANLDVPPRTMKLAERFLDSVMDENTKGYGYVNNNAQELTHTRTAIGLLCRQYLQGLGPASPIMSQGVDNYVKKYPPVDAKNIYYYYYATQVLHHFGGKNWVDWNLKMRDALIKAQERKEKSPGHAHEDGSWTPDKSLVGNAGGRVLQTSLSLLTLEVYYRHLPLYRRDIVDKKDLTAK